MTLRERYDLLMSVREGETEDDAASRLHCVNALGVGNSLAHFRPRVAAGNAKLISLGIEPEERVSLLRAALPTQMRWLASEAVYERPPAEGDFARDMEAILAS